MITQIQTPDLSRLDRRGPLPVVSIDAAPDRSLAEAQRGDLALTKDGAQHRRFHGLYEDLLS